jgi:pyruvate carboxylase
VARGEVLLTLEAMKMETSVRAERDATIMQVLVKPGAQVDTKDLLVLFA